MAVRTKLTTFAAARTQPEIRDTGLGADELSLSQERLIIDT